MSILLTFQAHEQRTTHMLPMAHVSFSLGHGHLLCSRRGGLQGNVMRTSWCVHKAHACIKHLPEEQVLLLKQLGMKSLLPANVGSNESKCFANTNLVLNRLLPKVVLLSLKANTLQEEFAPEQLLVKQVLVSSASAAGKGRAWS